MCKFVYGTVVDFEILQLLTNSSILRKNVFQYICNVNAFLLTDLAKYVSCIRHIGYDFVKIIVIFSLVFSLLFRKIIIMTTILHTSLYSSITLRNVFECMSNAKAFLLTNLAKQVSFIRHIRYNFVKIIVIFLVFSLLFRRIIL